MRLLPMGDDEEALPPIPANITDIARMFVKDRHKNEPQVNHAPPQNGGTASPMPPQPTVAAQPPSSTPAPPQPPQPQSVSTTTDGLKPVVPLSAFTAEEVRYFRDPNGNEYKTVGKQLFVKGWFRPGTKARVVNESNGREVPLNGKVVELFGWKEVKSGDPSEDEVPSEDEFAAEDEENKGGVAPCRPKRSNSCLRRPKAQKRAQATSS